jgi:hypothetical protein
VRYLVVPFSADLERRLVTGQISLRDALTQSRAWIFDLNNSWEPVRAWRVEVDMLPWDALPRPGAMLYAHLQPVISSAKARHWANDLEIPASSGPQQGIRAGTFAHA